MNLYRKALRLAGVSPRDISYVEAHGTGTPVGDPIEVDSIRAVFGDSSRPQHHDKTYLGSVKSNIGHSEGSSGISALIKVLLMQQKGIIPQQALFKNLNPAITPLEPYHIEIPKKNVPWISNPRIACVNNYGASGNNSVMIVTPPPVMAIASELTSVATFPVSISAFSPSSLESYCSALLAYIENLPSDHTVQDVAYHLSRRKNLDLPYSVCGTISSIQQLKNLCISTIAEQPPVNAIKRRPVVLYFSGQTGKTSRVSRALYDSFAVFRKHLDDCETVLQRLDAPSILPAIFGPEPHDDLVLSHLALFSGQYASAMTWIDCGLQPDRLVGHSFGQLTALCVSGVLSLHDTLRLITVRARLIRDLSHKDAGSMIAIKADLSQISKLLSEHQDLNLEIACYNGAQSHVLAGHSNSIDALQTVLESSKPIRWKRLAIEHAFHSVLMEPLVRPLRDLIQEFHFHEATIPLETCSKDGTWQSLTPELVAAHIREPVYFHQTVERISSQLGPCTWLEAGSGSGVPTLRQALETQSPAHEIKSVNLDSASSADLLVKVTLELWKLRQEVQFWSFHKSHQHQYKMLHLPPYQFDKSRHWLEYQQLAVSGAAVQPTVKQQASIIQPLRVTGERGEFRIDTKCEEWQTTCSGNKVLGTLVCPVSLLFELVFKAINTIPGAPVPKSNRYHVHRWTMRNPIPANPETGLNLTLTKSDSSKQWKFVVGDGPNAKSEYASGTISADIDDLEDNFARFQRLVDIKHVQGLSDDTTADSAKGSAVYKIVSNAYQIPKSRHVINEVSIRGNEMIGYLRSPAKDHLVSIEGFLHIPLLCLNGLHDREDDDIYVLTSAGPITYRDLPGVQPNEDISWAVYGKCFGFEGSGVACDIFVFDVRSEQLCATILDLKFTKTKTSLLQRALGAPIANPQQLLNSLDNSLAAASETIPQLSHPQKFDSPSEHHEHMRSNELPDLVEALFDLLVRVADVDREILHRNIEVIDIGIDSLMGMEIAEEINNFFSVKLAIEDFLSAPDMGSVCQLIADQTTNFYYDPNTSSGASSDASSVDGSCMSPATSATSNTKHTRDDGDFELISCSVSQPISIQGSLDPMLKAFDSIREQFDHFAKGTGCDVFCSHVYPLLAELTIAYTTEAFEKLGCNLSSIQAGEEIPEIPHAPRYDKLLARLMYALRDSDLVIQSTKGWTRTSKSNSSRSSSSELFERLRTEYPQFAPEYKLLQMVGSTLDECLAGNINPITLLFGSPEKRQLMADLYTTSPIQHSVSQQLATFIKQCFHSRATDQTLRVLEIGGGTCGTSVQAVDAFAQLNISVEYTFSDISPAFVTAAKTKLRAHDFVKFQTLDITADPNPKSLGYYDVILATNAIHATADACKSAINARQMLRHGGFMAVAEYTKPFYYLDVIFGQLDGWWLFQDGRDHAFMDSDGWNVTLRQAGFDHVDWTQGQSEESKIFKIFLAY